MSMLGGLFSGSRGQHPNFERIAHALHSHLGLNVVPPPAEVLAIIDQMTTRELLHFDNMQSMQGMQESVQGEIGPRVGRLRGLDGDTFACIRRGDHG